MILPPFWRRASFSVAETADLIGVPEVTLRTWLQREPSGDFAGAKDKNRVFLSGNDAFFYLMVKEFTAHGTPVRAAMAAAAGVAGWTWENGLPPEKYIILRHAHQRTEFAHADQPSLDERPVVVIPLHTLAARLVERAEAIYQTEAR